MWQRGLTKEEVEGGWGLKVVVGTSCVRVCLWSDQRARSPPSSIRKSVTKRGKQQEVQTGAGIYGERVRRWHPLDVEHKNPRLVLDTFPKNALEPSAPCVWYNSPFILWRWRQDQKRVTNLFSSSADGDDSALPVAEAPSFSLTQCSALPSGRIAK